MSYRLELKLALLLAVAVLVAVVAARRSGKPPPEDPRASTVLSGPDGSRALYEALARLGHPVQRWRTPLFELTRDPRRRPALLVVLAPPLPLEPAELDQVVRFVRAGGEVVAAGRGRGGDGIARCVGWRVVPRERRLVEDSLPVAGTSLALPPVTRVLEPVDTAGGGEPEQAVKRVGGEATGCGRLVPPPLAQDTLLRVQDGRPVILSLSYRGGGRVTLAADAGYFRNRVWRTTDVPYLVAPLLVPRRPGRIAWDEYHQGFGREGSLTAAVLGWLAGSPGGWAILQLAAVALVWLAVSAMRFGPARPVIERRRRSPLEHLEALAAGLEGAAGVETAVELTVSGLRRRLSRSGHALPPARGGDHRQWLATLELALPTPRGRQAVRRLQAVVGQPGGAERVLAAAQAVEDVWEELHPRTTRDAS